MFCGACSYNIRDPYYTTFNSFVWRCGCLVFFFVPTVFVCTRVSHLTYRNAVKTRTEESNRRNAVLDQAEVEIQPERIGQ
jgi:hypothetical protein